MHTRLLVFDPEAQQNADVSAQSLKGTEVAPPKIMQLSAVENVGNGVGEGVGESVGSLVGEEVGDTVGKGDGGCRKNECIFQ